MGSGEGTEPRAQFELFRELAGGPIASHLFTPDEGADTHCQVGNLSYSAAVVLDWLTDTLGPVDP